MNKGWHTKADVLKDLGEVNGRRTGAEHLDQHVVAGERPPPIHLEIPDADELRYFGGPGLPPGAASHAGPDLDGISVMLKLVNDMDDTADHEPRTVYRSNVTDEIRISKLNPCAGEYVPGATRYGTRNMTNHSSKKLKSRDKSDRTTFSKNVQVSHSTDEIPSIIPKYKSMFKSKSGTVTENGSVSEKTETPVGIEQVKPQASQEPASSPSNKEIQDKIKSTVIASSNGNSLHMKRQKNVAIATLLKMGMITEPVKLIKPEYFENLPPKDIEKKSDGEEVPSKSSIESDVNVDQDSISKVNGWFNNMECPKPKLLPQEPLTLKENPSSITFKKKNSSVASPSSEASKETKESPKRREVKAFKPSSYANDLLKKYETNAQNAASSPEDLGTRLERQLRERDEVIRQKLARQNAS